MYWRAHALYKASRKADAARQVLELERTHPSSSWLNEAKALRIEYQGPTDEDEDEDELRLFALSRLMERDADRALPLVMEILNNSTSESTRQDALFVLGMSSNPEAQSFIAQAARDSGNPQLQVDAVQMLAMSGNEASLDLLKDLYDESASAELKSALIQAYMIKDQPAPLLEILKQEQDPEVQRDLIYALGTMGPRVNYMIFTQA